MIVIQFTWSFQIKVFHVIKHRTKIQLQCYALHFIGLYISGVINKHLRLFSQESWLDNVNSACCSIGNIIYNVRFCIVRMEQMKENYNYVQLYKNKNLEKNKEGAILLI